MRDSWPTISPDQVYGVSGHLHNLNPVRVLTHRVGLELGELAARRVDGESGHDLRLTTRPNVEEVVTCVPYRMRRARGSATPIVIMVRAPTAPIDANAHRAPTSAASVPASMLPRVMTTELM
jgi:hypothetical protein